MEPIFDPDTAGGYATEYNPTRLPGGEIVKGFVSYAHINDAPSIKPDPGGKDPRFPHYREETGKYYHPQMHLGVTERHLKNHMEERVKRYICGEMIQKHPDKSRPSWWAEECMAHIRAMNDLVGVMQQRMETKWSERQLESVAEKQTNPVDK